MDQIMAFTTSDLESIQNAMTMGELSVSIQGRTITYRSYDELMKMYRLISSEVNKTATSGSNPYSLAKFS